MKLMSEEVGESRGTHESHPCLQSLPPAFSDLRSSRDGNLQGLCSFDVTQVLHHILAREPRGSKHHNVHSTSLLALAHCLAPCSLFLAPCSSTCFAAFWVFGNRLQQWKRRTWRKFATAQVKQRNVRVSTPARFLFPRKAQCAPAKTFPGFDSVVIGLDVAWLVLM